MQQGDGETTKIERCGDGGMLWQDGVQTILGRGGEILEGVATFKYLGEP